MDVSLQIYPIRDEVASHVLQELWISCQPIPKSLSQVPVKPNLQTYFSRHYTHSCQRFARDGGTLLSTKTHSDVVKLARCILQDSTRAALVAGLDGEARACENAVNLCASLVTMCSFGDSYWSCSASRHLPWASHHTLRQAIAAYLEREKTLQPDNPQIRRVFNARNIARIGGMRIRWTDSLMNHLSLSEDDQAVFIFHHADFLRFQSCLADEIFPEGFIDETLRTLALLFPQNDRRTKRWLRKQISEYSLDPSLARVGNVWSQDRRFERFQFWHDRLVMLKLAFDDSTPRRLSQWWGDRRNSPQWYTFWVAVLVFAFTVFFGLVQSIAAVLQVYLSWKAL